MARITGRFGTLSVDAGGGIPGAVANLINWTLEINAELVPCARKGEVGNRVAVGGIDVRITAEKMVDNAGGSVLSALAINQFGAADPVTTAFYPGKEIQYTLDQLPDPAVGIKLVGPGYVQRGGATAPRDLASDTFEIVGTELPVIV